MTVSCPGHAASPKAGNWNRPSSCRHPTRARTSPSSAARSSATAGRVLRHPQRRPPPAPGRSSGRPEWARPRSSTSSSRRTSTPAGGWRSSIRTGTLPKRSSMQSRRAARTMWSSSTPATASFRSRSIRCCAETRTTSARRLRRRLGIQEALRRQLGAAAGAHSSQRPPRPSRRPGTSLLSLQRLLAETAYRKMLTGRLSRPAREGVLGRRVRLLETAVPGRGHRAHPEQGRPVPQPPDSPGHRRPIPHEASTSAASWTKDSSSSSISARAGSARTDRRCSARCSLPASSWPP